MKIVVVNLGGTSSKLALYEDDTLVHELVIRHSKQEMDAAPLAKQQRALRANKILAWLDQIGITMSDIDAFAMRGGALFKARKGGTYRVDDKIRKDMYETYIPDKPPISGTRIVLQVVEDVIGDNNIPIYITDPPYVDEMSPEAHLTGHPKFQRRSGFHALNQKAIAREAAKVLGKPYEQCRLVVAHLGGGVSIGAHLGGKVIDVNDCTTGEGPYSPERAGSLPVGALIEACFSGDYTKDKLLRISRSEGGVLAHLGTSDMREVEERMNQGDEQAGLLFRGMAYQVSKSIGAYCAVLDGEVDAIILTGGIVHSKAMADMIEKRVRRFAPVMVYPGEIEMAALAAGALRVMRQEEPVQTY